MTCHIYGIKNCDTMKKAFAWCDEHGVAYEFHDYKKLGVPRERLVAWCQSAGWKTLLNTRGMMWRRLSDEERADVEARDQRRSAELNRARPWRRCWNSRVASSGR